MDDSPQTQDQIEVYGTNRGQVVLSSGIDCLLVLLSLALRNDVFSDDELSRHVCSRERISKTALKRLHHKDELTCVRRDSALPVGATVQVAGESLLPLPSHKLVKAHRLRVIQVILSQPVKWKNTVQANIPRSWPGVP